MERKKLDYKILVDADAIPSQIRNVIIRYSKRKEKCTIFVSNHFFKISKHPFIEQFFVEKKIDQADNHIITLSKSGCLVITQDILLAKQSLEKGAQVLNQYSEELTLSKVKEKLALRDFFAQVRDINIETSSNKKTYSSKDLENFSNALNNRKW